jgi:hypothetical protein
MRGTVGDWWRGGSGQTRSGPLRTGIPAAQPFAAFFARDRSGGVTGPGGGGNYTPGTGPENEKTEGNVMTFLEVQCGNGPGDPTTTGHRGDPGAGKLMVLGLTVFF